MVVMKAANEITALDAGMTLLSHAGRRRPGTSEFLRWAERPMTTNVHILAFSTSNYDAMVKFFRDFGFMVAEDPHDQLTPFFEHGRASRINRGDLEFQLEESDFDGAKASFNLALSDSSDAEIERVKSLGYECDFQTSLYGEFHSFRSPDGGTIVL